MVFSQFSLIQMKFAHTHLLLLLTKISLFEGLDPEVVINRFYTEFESKCGNCKSQSLVKIETAPRLRKCVKCGYNNTIPTENMVDQLIRASQTAGRNRANKSNTTLNNK